MKKFILAFISIIFSFSTLADVDKRFVKKRMIVNQIAFAYE